MEKSDQIDEEINPASILSLLKAMPPSAELLDFYRKKIERYNDEAAKLLSMISGAKAFFLKYRRLETTLADKNNELLSLKQNLEELHSALTHERKLVLRLYGENDKLRIQELEDRRKLQVLLQLSGKTDEEIVRIIDKEEGFRKINITIPERLTRYLESQKSDKIVRPMKKTKESLEFEILSLEHHLIEQEKCHMEQISQLENLRRINARERRGEADQYEYRIKELAEHIISLEEKNSLLARDLIESKSEFRKEESQWMKDRERFTRKLQFLEHYGTSTSAPDIPGFFTEARCLERRFGDKRYKKLIQELNTEVAEHKNLADSYRTKLLALETEMEGFREQNLTSKEALKKRTKVMTEQLEIMRNRYEALEERRRKEAEGYQSDVKLLTEKLREVERRLVQSSLGKSKEHEQFRVIRAQERKIEELERLLKQNPEWRY